MKIVVFTLCLFFSWGAVWAQKKVIDHTVYDQWKTLSAKQVSANGELVTYEIKPHKGDGFLYVYQVKTGKLDSIPRGTKAKFSGKGSYITMMITPGADTLRKCELNKLDKKKWPKDSLAIFFPLGDSIVRVPKVKSFISSETGEWMAYLSESNELNTGGKKKKSKKKKEDYKSDGTVLTIYHPNKESFKVKDVKDHMLSETGEFSAYVIHKKTKSDSVFLVVRNNLSGTLNEFSRASTDIQKLNFSKDNRWLSYLASADTAKSKNYSLQLVDLGTMKASLIADTNSSFVSSELAPSTSFGTTFTDKGDYLFFGLGERAKPEEKDTLLESEKAKVDVWNYKDDRLQPQQLKELKRDKNSAHIYVYHLNSGKVTQLSDDTLDLSLDKKVIGERLLANSKNRYQSRYNWEYPWKRDYYSVDLQTGNRKLLIEGNAHNVSLSPKGSAFIYFDKGDYHYQLVNEDRGGTINSIDKPVWVEDMNGMSAEASNYGVIGWTAEDVVLLQSRQDIYQYSISTTAFSCITCIVNESKSIEIKPVLWNSDSAYVDLSKGLLTGFDTKTKGTHVYEYRMHGDHADVVEIAYYDAELLQFNTSKDFTTVVFQKMTVKDYPDAYVYTTTIKDAKRISTTNPQQSEFIWPEVELVKWKAYDGTDLEGLLYKPDNYDPSKKYPLLIYYYELYTDRYHQHYIPKPTASIIFATEYTSAGYIVFMPDIRYKEGYPARSAYNAIMSGTDHVLKLVPNIDSMRMGLQGQSWGGYQTAQLITMTKRYAAAMAGAPVSNMFSAYGGIRWGSGLNRQFQYEKAQSRIGATIWEKPELYVENSPIFHIPNIETPLLIMHNDADGAVPWYQGIEMFTAMKRLDKPVWMLNYNDDDHNLMKDANRRDLSIRMRQFFDHYLLEKPAPKWLIEGVPAVDKGIDYGLEVIEE